MRCWPIVVGIVVMVGLLLPVVIISPSRVLALTPCYLTDPSKSGCLHMVWDNSVDTQGAQLFVDGLGACRTVANSNCAWPVAAGRHSYGIRREDGAWCIRDDEVTVPAGTDVTVGCNYHRK